MNRIESQAVLAGILLKRVRDDRHPSTTDMDLIEQTIPPQLLPRYAEVLFEKVAQDNRPSVEMIRRLQRVISRLPQ